MNSDQQAGITEIVETLATWHPEIADLLHGRLEDLHDEFDRLPPLSDPKKNRLGPFHRDKALSKIAALRNFPRSGSQRHKVLIAIRDSGDRGLIREEIEIKFGLIGSTVHPRVLELIQGGWVVETERTRLTRYSGSPAAILILSDRAKREFARNE